MNFKKTAKYIHVYTILTIVVNYIVRAYSDYGLIDIILLILKILFWVSGIALFFYYSKPFRKRAIYLGLFLFAPLIAVIAWITDGIFGAVVISVLFFWFSPDDVESKQDNIVVYSQFSGFMGGSARFVVRENYYVVEKDMGRFNIPYDTRSALKKINVLNKDSVIIYYQEIDELNKAQIVTDTINLEN